MNKKLHPPLPPRKVTSESPIINGGITLTAIAAKIYNAPLLTCVLLEVEKVLRKNHNGSEKSLHNVIDFDYPLN